MNESRINKALKNARVNFIFYFLMFFISFYSRKIFLDTLGPEFIGLAGTLQNILQMLSLAEIGIASAVSFHLYKPIREENTAKINDLISLYGWFYRIVGSIILGLAVIVSLFFPVIFGETSLHLGVVYFVFFCFLGSSLISYFLNYKQILLTADQKNYVVAQYLQGGQIVKVFVQLFCCYYYCNYYLWAVIEFSFSIFACIVLNKKIKKTYPWLVSLPQRGKLLYKEYPTIIKSTKQIFIHKIKDFLLKQSDQILVFAFVSLKYVAYYNNYSLIISRVTSLCESVMNSAGAGVGNLVAEGDARKIMKVFWELMSMRYFVAGTISAILYFIIPPFIHNWLGEEYILPQIVNILLCVNMFISISRITVDNFNHAYGQYADIWAAWTEGGINLAVTIVAGLYYGLVGILLGKIVSLFFIVLLWKPYYLFRDGFGRSIAEYWWPVLRYVLLFIVSFAITYYVSIVVPLQPEENWAALVLYALIVSTIFALSYFCLMLQFAHGFKDFLVTLIKRRRK